MGLDKIAREAVSLTSTNIDTEKDSRKATSNYSLETHVDQNFLSFVHYHIRSRRLRCEMIGQILFSDPFWDILTAVFYARLKKQHLSIAAAAATGQMASATGLRYIDVLEKKGYLYREKDLCNDQGEIVKISDHAFALMEEYFNRILAMAENRGFAAT